MVLMFSDSDHVSMFFFYEKLLEWNTFNTEDSVVHRWPDPKWQALFVKKAMNTF